ncbi:hypothetical protein [Spiroplasma chrysopicola]|uniref:Transmembrane protein n=1 Tax=Spiroplasma chrysopicola DF-1 TaxID=1276227 RepID=R4UH42_9MOLU|nr:hypothetical protein [Spiroplasma chrysopicola]AGM24626.1 hypothetical protein SCHRY_v1c00390 [Spiroplasma chrysopicola DF-1]
MEVKKKQIKWTKIINLTAIILLTVLTIIFSVLIVIDQKKFIIAFAFSVLFLGLWVGVYFLIVFLGSNKEAIKSGAKKLVSDYRKKPTSPNPSDNEKPTSKAEKIKKLEAEIAKLKAQDEESDIK